VLCAEIKRATHPLVSASTVVIAIAQVSLGVGAVCARAPVLITYSYISEAVALQAAFRTVLCDTATALHRSATANAFMASASILLTKRFSNLSSN
jgi:hypothetical protein